MKSKESILSKSKALFERHGYQKTTLTDIAQSVGKVKTAIYYYFSSKEDIFTQLVRSEAEEFFFKLKGEIDKELKPINKLEVYIEARICLMQKITKRYTFLKQEFFELMPLIEEHRREFYQMEVKMIEEILENGCEDESMVLNAPNLSATMLVNSLKGLEIQMFVTDQMIVEGSNLKEFRDFFLYGILKLN